MERHENGKQQQRHRNPMSAEDRTLLYQTARSLIHRNHVTTEELDWVMNRLPHDCDRALGLRARLICKKAGAPIDWASVCRRLSERLM
jgi:hypothetical protein